MVKKLNVRLVSARINDVNFCHNFSLMSFNFNVNPQKAVYFAFKIYSILVKIVLFKSLRNWKRHNKENFALKSNSNKIMFCGGKHYLVLNKIST